MATATVDCLYTTVLNISGREAVFSFLPPHGKRMAIDEQLTIAGNIVDRLASKTSNRQFKALERALLGDANHPASIAIINTPAVYVMTDPGKPFIAADPGHVPPIVGQAYAPPIGMMIDGTGGTLTAVDPCWQGP